ncbi:MAG: DUF3106 domain-containing protein, partial [Gammaproteobacteria bacterium]|nr:DUF3106 domain-containing protein [Gammaproteobacteria bacterium]
MNSKHLLAILALLASAATMADNGVDWESLNEEQQQVLRVFADSWAELDPERQRQLSVGAERWSQMS